MPFWLQRLFRRFTPPPPIPPRLPALTKPPIPLQRVFPPLPKRDERLALEAGNTFTETEIAGALASLRGGEARPEKGRSRVTRPARFQLALRQLRGFSNDCLLVQAASKVPVQDMYAAYLLWAADNSQQPIGHSDFDFAMSDYLQSVGGIRSFKSYDGCRIRQDFVRRLENMNAKDVKRRLGMSLEDLMNHRSTRPDDL